MSQYGWAGRCCKEVSTRNNNVLVTHLTVPTTVLICLGEPFVDLGDCSVHRSFLDSGTRDVDVVVDEHEDDVLRDHLLQAFVSQWAT